MLERLILAAVLLAAAWYVGAGLFRRLSAGKAQGPCAGCAGKPGCPLGRRHF